jgi:hypothetical protein
LNTLNNVPDPHGKFVVLNAIFLIPIKPNSQCEEFLIGILVELILGKRLNDKQEVVLWEEYVDYYSLVPF